jgi:hypothetical protein
MRPSPDQCIPCPQCGWPLIPTGQTVVAREEPVDVFGCPRCTAEAGRLGEAAEIARPFASRGRSGAAGRDGGVTDLPRLLDYASPPPERPEVKRLTPFNVAAVGGGVGVLLLLFLTVSPVEIDREPPALRAVRWAGALVLIACAILYALLRIWGDPRAGRGRRVVFTICLAASVSAWAMAQLSVRGWRPLPPLGLGYAYWRWVVASAAAVSIAVAFCAASAAWRLAICKGNTKGTGDTNGA